ncbi:MAG: hypothetical protein WCO04_10255 [Pseudomonadota bacterium]
MPKLPPVDQLAMLRQSMALDVRFDDTATTLDDSYFAGDSRLFSAYMSQAMLD